MSTTNDTNDQKSLGFSATTTTKKGDEKSKEPNLLDHLYQDEDDEHSAHDDKPAGTLYVAPIERYVDDGELYQQRYNDYSRLNYWEFLLDHPRPPKLPHDHLSWTAQGGNSNFAEEIHYYPTFEKRLLACTLHHYWDYAYLYLFGLWILLVTAYYDALVRTYILVPSYLLYFPLVLMLLTQAIPIISVIYLVSRCNDLMKLVASRTFGSWAFSAVLVAQYIEYTYYSGHKREDKAGKCRLEYVEDWENLDHDGNPRITLKSRPGLVSKLLQSFRRDSKIMPTQHSSASQDHSAKDQDSYHEEIPEDVENDSEPSIDASHGEKSQGDGDESVISTGIPMGLEGGYLQRMKEESEAAERAAKQAALEDIQRREALVTDWHEWKCLVCGTKNRRPRHPLNLSFKPAYYEKGVYLKKIHAHLVPDRDIPSCKKCLTPADYKPRLCTAHIFPYYKKPYEAFENYPEAVPHIPRSRLKTCMDKAASCLFGQRNHPDSRLMINDWRMSIYLSSRFPLVPRPVKDPKDIYQVGEIVECRKQKMDWTRARVIESRSSHVYDIIYDTGDEVRLLEESELRLPPSKGLYAYRVELGLALLGLFIPIGLMGGIFLQMPGFTLLPFTGVAAVLLGFRVLEFLDSFREYYAAGCCLLFQQHLLVSYPLLTVVICGALALLFGMMGIPAVVIAIFIILTMFSSLPVIYIKRPTFAVLCLVLFGQLSICFLLVAIRIDGHGRSFIPWVMIDALPALTSVYTLLRYRRWLGYIWDVSLYIRPVEYADYEVSYARQFYDFVNELISSFKDDEPSLPPPQSIEGDIEKKADEVESSIAPSLEMAAIGKGSEVHSPKPQIKFSDDEDDSVV